MVHNAPMNAASIAIPHATVATAGTDGRVPAGATGDGDDARRLR